MSSKYNENSALLCTSSCPNYQTARRGRNLVYYCVYLNKREKTHEGRPCLHLKFLEDLLKSQPVNIEETLEDIKTAVTSYRKKHRNSNQRFDKP